MTITRCLFSLLATLASVFPAYSYASAVAVGKKGEGCDFDDLQSAINAAHGAVTEIQVMADYVGGPVSIDDKILQIKGGYTLATTDAKCAFPIAPNPFNGDEATLTQLNGSGGKPVIGISGDSQVQLRNLYIVGAKNDGGDGGAIAFNASGSTATLELFAVHIFDNRADNGGGIFFDGAATINQLTLDEDTSIAFNTANLNGGGILLKGGAHLQMTRPRSSINNNKANLNTNDSSVGNGGGIAMFDQASANIGSPGLSNLAAIDANQATWGAGISVVDQASVNVYTTISGTRTRIANNKAATLGGGVFLKTTNGHPQFCGYGVGIDGNSAANGGAIESYGLNSFPSIPINLNDTCDQPPDEVACPNDVPCNTIDGNRATNSTASIVAMSNTTFLADRMRLQGNTVNENLFLNGGLGQIALQNCLIADNTLSSSTSTLLRSDVPVALDSCTVTNNAVTAVFREYVIAVPQTTLQGSLISQPYPNTVTFVGNLSNVTVADSIAVDAGKYVPSRFKSYSNFVNIDAEFVNSSPNGDYHLTRNSPLDFYAGCSGVDLDGKPRGVAFDDATKPCDPGAYERSAATFPADENFDELDITNPLWPDGWSTSVLQSEESYTSWSIVRDFYVSAPFAAHAVSPPFVSDSALAAPSFLVTHAGLLTFKHAFDLETTFDGAILEISTDHGVTYKEITRAGGRFTTGGYSGNLQAGGKRNPIEIQYPGGAAWTGSSSGYVNVGVELPASVNGKNVRLRWRVGTDGTASGVGYYLDDIHVDVNRLTSDLIFADGFD
jgi:hypothetical protein